MLPGCFDSNRSTSKPLTKQKLKIQIFIFSSRKKTSSSWILKQKAKSIIHEHFHCYWNYVELWKEYSGRTFRSNRWALYEHKLCCITNGWRTKLENFPSEIESNRLSNSWHIKFDAWTFLKKQFLIVRGSFVQISYWFLDRWRANLELLHFNDFYVFSKYSKPRLFQNQRFKLNVSLGVSLLLKMGYFGIYKKMTW